MKLSKNALEVSEMLCISEHAQMSKNQDFFEHSQKSMIFDESSIFDNSRRFNWDRAVEKSLKILEVMK